MSWHRRLEAFAKATKLPVVLAEHTRSPRRHPYAWPKTIAKPWRLDGLPGTVTLNLATVR